MLATLVARASLRRHERVLELGAGDSSTPMLHHMCRALSMKLWTMETDGAWLERYKEYAWCDHKVEHVKDWLSHPFIVGDDTVDLLFVDCAPGEVRHLLIEKFATRAKCIVAHDSERDHGAGGDYRYEKVTPLFKYVTEFRRFRPYTLILSNHEPFEIEEYDRVWYPPNHG